MKNSIYKILFLVFLPLAFVGCEEELEVYDVENGESVAAFNSTSSSFAVDDSGESVTFVEVGVTAKSSSDRTFSVTVDESSTVDPSAYQISDLVIPAGEFVGNVKITGVFENLPETGTAALVLNLTEITGGTVADYRQQHTVTMFRFCPFQGDADFLGDYQLTVLSPGIFGVDTLKEGVVTLTEGATVAERRFDVAALPAFGDFAPFSFRMSLVCGKILVQQRNINVGCGGANAVGPSSTVESTFDLDDDSSLTINFVDDVREQCQESVEVSIMLTKI